MIDKLKAFFDGKKSYLAAGGLAALSVALFCGVEIPPEDMAALLTALGGAGLAFLRLAMKKMEAQL